MIQSTGLNFILDLPLLLVLLATLQRFNYADWGIGTFLTPQQPGEDISLMDNSNSDEVHEATFALESARQSEPRDILESTDQLWFSFPSAHVKLDMMNPISRSHGLFGRNTHVFPVTEVIWNGGQLTDKPLVAKFQWAEVQRTSEGKVITLAQTIGRTNPFIRGHIPEVYGDVELREYSTGDMWKRLGARRALRRRKGKHTQGGQEAPQKKTAARVLRVLLMRYLDPLTKLYGHRLQRAFWDIVYCKSWFHKLTFAIRSSTCLRSLFSVGKRHTPS